MRRFAPITLIALALALTSCANPIEPARVADEVHEGLKRADRKAFEQQLETRLTVVGALLAEMDTEIAASGELIEPDFLDELERLNGDFAEAGSDWAEVESAVNPDGWSFMAESLRKRVDDLEYDVVQAREELDLRLAR